jgi:hypothetical protein
MSSCSTETRAILAQKTPTPSLYYSGVDNTDALSEEESFVLRDKSSALAVKYTILRAERRW